MTSNSQPGRVLILGASPRVSIPVARSLHAHGIPVEVASFHPAETDFHSSVVQRFHQLPDRIQNPDKFAAAFIALLRDRKFDVIFPAGDPPLAALADFYDRLGPLKIGCPPPAIVERVLNKSLTLETAVRCGIRVPFSRRISTIAELDSVGSQLRFPLVAKPEKKGAAAFRIFYFNTLVDLASAFKKHNWGGVLLQEYCPGVGVGIELLMHNRECIASFQHRRLKEAPVSGGVAVLAISEEPDAELLQSSITLLQALDWEGVAMVEYRVDPKTRNAVLMEVNGRFWGSVSLPIKAGVDFPFYYWQVLRGEQPVVPEHYKVGLCWRWSPGYFDRIQSVLYRKGAGTTPSSGRNLYPSPAGFSPFTCEALWSWSDPIPFFVEMGRAARPALGGAFKSLSRKFLPRGLKRYAGTYYRLAPAARPAYRKLRLHDALRISSANGADARETANSNLRSFLFVCYGNLMRSPMAETMLKYALAERGIEDVIVRSAGLHASPGREAHEWALVVSKELGMPLDDHRAQMATPDLISTSGTIFAMDFENLAELQTLYPEATHKTCLLSKYASGRMRGREIPDPYFGDIDTTRRCYTVLSECIANLTSEIEALRYPKENLTLSHQ